MPLALRPSKPPRAARPTRCAPRAVRARSALALPTLALAALALCAAAVHAQAVPPRRPTAPPPAFWISGSAALLQPETILDGRTNAAWEFARNAIQYRASLEYALASATIGVQGSWAPAVPTTVRALGLAERPPLVGCQPQCAASADLLGLSAIGHVGGGVGVHQVIEASAGVMQLRNLRLDGGTTLPPEQDTDLHASIGYGIGYGLSPRAAITLVQEFGIVSHQRDFLPRDRSGITQQRVTRLALRVGSGTRR